MTLYLPVTLQMSVLLHLLCRITSHPVSKSRFTFKMCPVPRRVLKMNCGDSRDAALHLHPESLHTRACFPLNSAAKFPRETSRFRATFPDTMTSLDFVTSRATSCESHAGIRSACRKKTLSREKSPRSCVHKGNVALATTTRGERSRQAPHAPPG